MPTHIRALTPTAEGKIIASNTEIKKSLLRVNKLGYKSFFLFKAGTNHWCYQFLIKNWKYYYLFVDHNINNLITIVQFT